MTLSLYIAKIYARALLMVLLVVIGIVFLFDIIELLRISNTINLSFSLMIKMAIMKNYWQLMRLLPFSIMIASMLAYAKMMKSHELIAARALGFSLWNLLWPAVLVTFLFSIFFIAVINPLGALGYSKYNVLKMRHIHQSEGFFIPSETGLWLKDKIGDDKYIINIMRVDEKKQTLHNIEMFVFSANNNKFITRYEADNAQIIQEGWLFPQATATDATNVQQQVENFTLNTNISLLKIQESLVPPEMISIWKIGNFMKLMRDNGISTEKYQFFTLKMLVLPFLNVAIFTLGATFIPKHPRFVRQNWFTLLGLLLGFIIYFLIDISAALALANNIPLWFGALLPAIVCGLIAFGMLLYYEEGR